MKQDSDKLASASEPSTAMAWGSVIFGQYSRSYVVTVNQSLGGAYDRYLLVEMNAAMPGSGGRTRCDYLESRGRMERARVRERRAVRLGCREEGQ